MYESAPFPDDFINYLINNSIYKYNIKDIDRRDTLSYKKRFIRFGNS